MNGWTDLLPSGVAGGVSSAVIYVFYRLHRDAVQSQKDRADDWRSAYERSEERAALRDKQVDRILDAFHGKSTGNGT